MALIFNPPPNWPAPPSKDWRPAPGWQPDPAWGPAPEGWNFWVEDTPGAAPAPVSPQITGDTPGTPVSGIPEQAEPAPAPADSAAVAEPTVPLGEATPHATDDDATRVLPANAASAQPAEGSEPGTSTPQGEADTAAPYAAGATGVAGAAASYQQAPQAHVPPASTPGQPAGQTPYPGYNQPAQSNPYAQGQAPYAGSQPYAQSQQYAQNQPYTQGGAPGQQANPYSQTAAATAASGGKKNFFTTGAGIVTIIGALLVVLLIALISTLVIGGGSKETSSSSDSHYSSSDESASEPDDSETVEEYGVAYGKDVQVADEDGSKVYIGNGNQIFTLEKPEGLESVAWLEYDFKGEDEYSSISFRTLAANDDLTGSIIDSAFEQNSTGSYWLDARTIYDDKYTEKLKVEAEGDWTIKVHPLSKAPVKKIGDSISGNAAAAFLYEPDAASNVKATFKAADEYGGDLQMTTQAEDLDAVSKTLVNTDQDNFEGSASMPEGKQYVSVSAYSGTWELTFEGK